MATIKLLMFVATLSSGQLKTNTAHHQVVREISTLWLNHKIHKFPSYIKVIFMKIPLIITSFSWNRLPNQIWFSEIVICERKAEKDILMKGEKIKSAIKKLVGTFDVIWYFFLSYIIFWIFPYNLIFKMLMLTILYTISAVGSVHRQPSIPSHLQFHINFWYQIGAWINSIRLYPKCIQLQT